MTRHHFDRQMGRIYGVFSDKGFQDERLKAIWKVSEDLPELAFTKIVEHFISTFRQPPLPKDFIEAALRERTGMRQRSFEEASASREPGCQRCCDAGVHEIRHDMSGKIILVRCECDIGRDSFHQDLPRWNALKFGKDFTPLFMGHAERYLIWKPDADWKPERGMTQLDEKIAIWKIVVNESRQFWRTFNTGESGPDMPPAG